YSLSSCCVVFIFHRAATNEIYTLSLHDALPISVELVEVALVLHQNRPGEVIKLVHVGEHHVVFQRVDQVEQLAHRHRHLGRAHLDRKSTRLNSSHVKISYAVFCLKKKKNKKTD